MHEVAAPQDAVAPAAPAASSTPSAPAGLSRRTLIIAAALSAATLIVLLGLEHRLHIHIFGVSDTPHFIWQAQAFLHGHYYLSPSANGDIVLLHGKKYIIYPPFPALLLLPEVAIFGGATSDIFFTTVCSALILGVLFLLFEQFRASGLTRRTWRENALMAILLYFGSITLWLSLGGRMWFTAHIVAMLMTLIALLLAFRRHYAWAAVALSCAFFTRGTLWAAFLFVLYMAWDDAGREALLARFSGSLLRRRPDWRAIPWRRLIAPAAITAATAGLYLLHNALIFGSPLESGYNLIIQQRYPYITHGVFSLSYFWRDLVANFFALPVVHFSGPGDLRPTVDMLDGGFGLSVFITTPLFLLLFWRNRRVSPLRAALWVTIGLIVVQVLFFHATGWFTFGPRYLFEAFPFAFALLALTDVRVDWRFVALGLIGIAINLAGAAQFWTGYTIHF